MAGFVNEVALCTNIQTDGNPNGSGSFTANGQVLIGGVAAPNMAVAVPTASNGVAWTLGQNSLAIAGVNATDTVIGVVELADNAESIAGTATDRANTPASLGAKLGAQTQHALPVGTGTSNAIGWLGPLTNGQLLVGSTGAAPVPAALTAGTGIEITNAAGSVTVNAVAGLPWQVVTDDTAMAVNRGYILNAATAKTLTLPAVAPVGSQVGVIGFGAGLWTIAQNAGQSIRCGPQVTTVGVTGNLAAQAQGDGIALVCVVANTEWIVLPPQGNLVGT